MLKKETAVKYLNEGESLELVLVGEIDHHTAIELRKESDAIINRVKPKKVALNLEGIGFMDSSGLGFIIGRMALVNKLGGELVLKKPNKSVKKICRLAGLERMVKTEN